MKNMNFVGQPDYCIHKDGKVYSLKSNRFLKPFEDSQGYLYIECYNQGKHRFAIHRLVALAFLPNPDDKPEVNHIHGDKSDNRSTQLEWMTSSENSTHAERTNLRNNSTLDDAMAHNICKQIETGSRNVDVANMFGVSRAMVSDIKNHKTYKYISCEYDFSKVKKSERISNDTVVRICELLQDSKSYKYIKSELNVESYIISRIKRRIHFNEISKNYTW